MKFLLKLDRKNRYKLEIMIEKILENKFEGLSLSPLKWKEWYFRVRVWKIRIVFIQWGEGNIIEDIWYRWDIYKWL